ncbi:MAG: hypothetical protein ACI88C_000519 [Acidimicrobiales bacterium]|jgi:hypothetical protein
MDIRIGIVNAPREVGIEMPDESSPEDVKAMIDAAVSAGAGLVWLTDKKGREVGFPADKVAYVEIGSSDDQRIGFS